MELIVERKQASNQNIPLMKPRFTLWAKLELEEDESALILKYKLLDAVVWLGFVAAEMRQSLQYAVFASIITIPLAVWIIGPMFGGGIVGSLLSVIVGFLLTWFGIYQKIRTTVTVRDMIGGHNFICPSIIDIQEQEDLIKKLALHVRQLLEDMKNWGAREVMKMDPLRTRNYELEETHAVLEKPKTLASTL